MSLHEAVVNRVTILSLRLIDLVIGLVDVEVRSFPIVVMRGEVAKSEATEAVHIVAPGRSRRGGIMYT